MLLYTDRPSDEVLAAGYMKNQTIVKLSDSSQTHTHRHFARKKGKEPVVQTLSRLYITSLQLRLPSQISELRLTKTDHHHMAPTFDSEPGNLPSSCTGCSGHASLICTKANYMYNYYWPNSDYPQNNALSYVNRALVDLL